MLFQTFFTMTMLHSMGTGQRFLKGGKMSAEQTQKMMKAVESAWETAPFDIKKRPTTVEEMIEYQTKYMAWAKHRTAEKFNLEMKSNANRAK